MQLGFRGMTRHVTVHAHTGDEHQAETGFMAEKQKCESTERKHKCIELLRASVQSRALQVAIAPL
jgi:hypothetical protein